MKDISMFCSFLVDWIASGGLGCRPILKTAINNEYVHDSCLLPIICFYFEASEPYLCSFNVPSFLLSDYCVRWVNDK